VEPICIGFTDDDRLGGRGSSDNVQLALKLSKYLIAESSKRNSRWTLRSELGLNARGKAVSSAKSDSLQGGQLRSDQVVSVNKQWMGRGGEVLRTAERSVGETYVQDSTQGDSLVIGGVGPVSIIVGSILTSNMARAGRVLASR